MFTFDDRITSVPATRAQVVSLHQSINSPHLAVPGKAAGPAQAYILGLRGATGISLFVYLALVDAHDCAVYVPAQKSLNPEEFKVELAEALGFAESMGFMMDDLNFRTRPAADQDQLLKTLPPFQTGAKKPALGAAPSPRTQAPKTDVSESRAQALGRLFSSF